MVHPLRSSLYLNIPAFTRDVFLLKLPSDFCRLYSHSFDTTAPHPAPFDNPPYDQQGESLRSLADAMETPDEAKLSTRAMERHLSNNNLQGAPQPPVSQALLIAFAT